MSLTRFEIDDRGVASLVVNRPEIRNAFNDELIGEITETVGGLDPSTRVLVISGEGKSFSAGADLTWMRSMAGYSQQENLHDSKRLYEMFEAIESCHAAVVAKVHGAAIAGATGIVAACDYVIAAEGTLFAFTEVRLGLVPAVISPYVVRKVGYSFARAMFMSAQRFDAQRAYEVGLVHKVVAPEELDAATAAVVDDLLLAGPEALGAARKLLHEIIGRSPQEVADVTVQTIAARRVSEEGQEGVTAFLEKRPPRWAGDTR